MAVVLLQAAGRAGILCHVRGKACARSGVPHVFLPSARSRCNNCTCCTSTAFPPSLGPWRLDVLTRPSGACSHTAFSLSHPACRSLHSVARAEVSRVSTRRFRRCLDCGTSGLRVQRSAAIILAGVKGNRSTTARRFRRGTPGARQFSSPHSGDAHTRQRFRCSENPRV